jgi:hypothetical protein
MSTSPGVVFSPQDGNETVPLQDGTHVLFEGRPASISHLACVPDGVWDRDGGPTGVRIESTKEQEMADENKDETRDDADAGQKLDKLLTGLGELHKRMDAMEEREQKRGDNSRARPPNDDAARARDDAAQARRDAERDQWMREDAAQCELDDEEENADLNRRLGEGEARPVAADAARQARRDRRRRRSDAAHRAADAAEDRKNREAMVDAQARADHVARCFGMQSEPPMAGEAPLAYRRRLLRRYQCYSPKFKDADLHAITDAATFGGVEAIIYADAQAASATPDVPDGRLMARVKVDPQTGARATEFFGRQTYIQGLRFPSKRVKSVNARMINREV